MPSRLVLSLLSVVLACLPGFAHAQGQTVVDVSAMIAELSAQITAAEAIPFEEGSEGAARALLAERNAALQDQEIAKAANQTAINAAIEVLHSAMPAFPQTTPPLTAEVAQEPVVESPFEGSEAERTIAQGEEEQIPQTSAAGGLPALEELTSPLAFGDRARRILSRPGAELRDASGNITTLPAFSVLYVFAEAHDGQEPVLAVGRRTRRADGWVSVSQTEEWRTMLVMSYAPNTGRDRTVFFASEDDVFEILDLEEGAADAIALIHEEIRDGTYDPERIVAVEPELTVDSVERPYLMPVLDFIRTNTDAHGDVTILQLAALNRDSTDTATAGQQPVGEDRISVEADAREFRVGVAFVIDTTRSMGPYIESAKDFVREVSFGLAERGLQDRFDFALVGFRDNTEVAQDVGYLRRVFRDFGSPTETDTLFADVDEMQPAVASTVNWREDAFAGIDLAIGDLSWDEVDTRLVFLITDASPRSVGDALASDTRMGPETINALAAQRNISLFVLHMQTEEAATISQNDEGYDDTVRGQQLYLRLAQTGDAAISKYFSVQGQTEQAFTDSLELVASLVIDQLSQLSLGGQLTDTSTALDDPFLAAISGGGPVVIDDEGDAPLVAAAVAGELFRYQTEYLGARSGVEAPDFYRAWAIDRDFANPNRRSLEVSVFVTREQLSDLANRLEDIVIRLREKDLGMGDFFTSVQAEAGSTAVDPEFRTFLPSYLEDLPYVTKFMNMTPRLWDDLGESGRTELLDEVEAKLASYRRIYATQDGWIRLDERSSEEEVYPLPLRDLP